MTFFSNHITSVFHFSLKNMRISSFANNYFNNLRKFGGLYSESIGSSHFAPFRKLHLPFSTSSSDYPSSPDPIRCGVPMEKIECVVIGAGVVGLAIARKLASYGHEVLVLESQSTFGTGISSRNSEVIHAGIYYPPKSLKAKFCVEGKKKLYEYCKDHNVPHEPIGKLIVAASQDQTPRLLQLKKNAEDNGVSDIKFLQAIDAQAMENNLKCAAALHSPSSGIVDSHSLMESLKNDAENNACIVSFNSTFIKGELSPSSSSSSSDSAFLLHVCDTHQLKIQEEEHFNNLKSNVSSDSETFSPTDDNSSFYSIKNFHPQPSIILKSQKVINAAGLDATFVAKRIQNRPSGPILDCHLARGNYFSLTGYKSPPFSKLIYPLPEIGGLGIHLTLDLSKSVKFGPDVEWINHPPHSIPPFLPSYNYDVNPNRVNHFYNEIRKYFPGLPDDSLQPSYAGIRPKLMGKNKNDFVDFSIQHTQHGSSQFVNLFGIESPGLTSALAIADHVHSLLKK